MDKEVYEWIFQNIFENVMIFVWWDMGYFLIGNIYRKDVVVWKKVYQGFFGEVLMVKEVVWVYMDYVIMFSFNQRSFVYYFMKKYNVSYIFVDRLCYFYGLIRYGFMEYVLYDIYFKLEFCNGGFVIYKFILEFEFRIEQFFFIEYYGDYFFLVNFFERFWMGYNYVDFDIGYKVYFNLNGWMVDLYYNLYNKIGDGKFKERVDWLLKWLEYK